MTTSPRRAAPDPPPDRAALAAALAAHRQSCPHCARDAASRRRVVTCVQAAGMLGGLAKLAEAGR
jgi:hypothetical protein